MFVDTNTEDLETDHIEVRLVTGELPKRIKNFKSLIRDAKTWHGARLAVPALPVCQKIE